VTMSCHCTKNRNRLALLVDRNSAEELPEDIRRILANCPTCREHYELLCAAMDSLHQVQSETAARLEKSLWPQLAHRLPEPRVQSMSFHEWKQKFVPLFSVTAACLALLVVFIGNRPTQNENRVYQTAINRNTSYSPLQYPTSFNVQDTSSRVPYSTQLYAEPFSQDDYPNIDSGFPDALEAQLRELLRQQKLRQGIERSRE